ncbi:hypothetical protein LIP_0817 [Limnochorda pilosa]|uniref:Uncharacterized protein n=1 Tax=Limnochorda pilosa TaxID=1555112 RepID=A0A0K2SIN1_LIMPI|nr:hypothetical protein LIP_0817 [Limnochorda pilosa]
MGVGSPGEEVARFVEEAVGPCLPRRSPRAWCYFPYTNPGSQVASWGTKMTTISPTTWIARKGSADR